MRDCSKRMSDPDRFCVMMVTWIFILFQTGHHTIHFQVNSVNESLEDLYLTPVKLSQLIKETVLQVVRNWRQAREKLISHCKAEVLTSAIQRACGTTARGSCTSIVLLCETARVNASWTLHAMSSTVMTRAGEWIWSSPRIDTKTSWMMGKSMLPFAIDPTCHRVCTKWASTLQEKFLASTVDLQVLQWNPEGKLVLSYLLLPPDQISWNAGHGRKQ
jgi:hypothetical protein